MYSNPLTSVGRFLLFTVGLTAVLPLVIIWIALSIRLDGQATWSDVVLRGELYLLTMVLIFAVLRRAIYGISRPDVDRSFLYVMVALLIFGFFIISMIWSELVVGLVAEPDPERAPLLEARARDGIKWFLGAAAVGSVVHGLVPFEDGGSGRSWRDRGFL